uniref:RNA helicase n=1 Tax=Acrobeloides nanus TaxID=290746 RepID=A0A914BWD0_9BILA
MSDQGLRHRRPHFIKPNDDIPSVSGPLLMEERAFEPGVDENAITSIVYNNPFASLSIQQQRSRLPIFKNRSHILYLLEKYQTVIVVGETGSGKSTQVPQYLVEAGWAADGRMIGITQPRRVAVVTLANRVSDERQCGLGDEVGYTVRFDDVTSSKTKIKYMSDGIMLRELMSDPLLTRYSVIMVDEAHERSMNTDLAIGLLRKIISIRSDLRVIISSATLDAELFRDFFELNETNDPSKDTATIISVEGRAYPVSTFYTKTGAPNYLDATVDLVIKIHKNEQPGDILAFLTGQDEVELACDRLREQSKNLKDCDKLWVVPMYGGLSAREQLKAFDSTAYRTRKVVVATNIAEASVTIPGIAAVIDCGFVKMRVINPKNGIETLMVIPISQSSAEQRAGRAGRIRPGKCYRLYPESEFDKLLPSTIPEMQRSHLAPVILQLKALGIQNVLRFHYLARPPADAMKQGLELLYALGAIGDDGLLTSPLGINMADLPLPPMFSKVLLSSGEFECSEEIAIIIAMTQIQDVFVVPGGGKRHRAEVVKRKFSVAEGDHLTLLNVFQNFIQNGRSKNWCNQHFLNYRGLIRAENIREQLVRYLKQCKIKMVSCSGLIGSTAKIRRCLVNGFFPYAARYDHTGNYVTIREEYPFKVYKGSAIMYRPEYPKWVIFTDVLQNSIRDISEIEPEWLYELAPQFYDFGTEGEIASKKRRTDDLDSTRKANLN